MLSKSAWANYAALKVIPQFKETSLMHRLARTLPPMPISTRAVICICIAAFGRQEIQTTERLLALLKKFRARDHFEIVIFANWPLDKQSDPEIIHAIEAAQADMPYLHLISSGLLHGTIGSIRGILHGTVLLWSERAGIDTIHITMDVDTVDVNSFIVDSYIKYFSRSINIKAIVGQLDWASPEFDIQKLPGFMLGCDLMRLLPKYGNKKLIANYGISVDDRDELVFSSRSFGRGVQSNIAFLGSAYRAAGGHEPITCDEFDSLLRRIYLIEKASGNLHSLAFGWQRNGIWVKSDARRALWAYATYDKPPMRQWDDFHFESGGEEIIRKCLPSDHELLRAETRTTLSEKINKTLEVYNLPEAHLRDVVTRVLDELGVRNYTLMFTPLAGDEALSVCTVII